MNSEFLSRISLIIVTWNGDELLRNCLSSIYGIYGSLPETVVVDNANLKSTEDIVAGYRNAKYISSPENLGFAGGNNLGLPHCTKEYVVLLNNDTVFSGDSFRPLVDFLDSHPKAAVAQGKLVLASHPHLLDGCGMFFSPAGILAPDGFLKRDAPEYREPHRIFAAGGAFFIFRKSLIDQVGGNLFYTHFKSYYEEIDFCHRTWLSGHEVWFVPTPTIAHRHSVTADRFDRIDILKQYYRNIWFSLFTCLDVPGMIRLMPCVAFMCIVQMTVKLCLGDTRFCRAYAGIIRSLWKSREEIKITRKKIKQFRTISDFELFRKIAIRGQPWSYYKNLIRANV